MKIVITGVPDSGKTTLANLLGKLLGIPVAHTDETKEMDWSAASEAVSYWLSRPGPWIIEGVVIPRALRKWITRHGGETGQPPEPPFDKIIVLREPRAVLTLQGQLTMAKTVIGLIEHYRTWIGDRWIEP